MIFLPEAEIERRMSLLDGARTGDTLAAALRITRSEPDFAQAWMLVGALTEDPEESVAALWEAVRLAPCSARSYMMLGDRLTQLDEADPMAKHLRVLSMWKVGFSDEVPELIAEHFAKSLGDEAREPETYEMLAAAGESELAKAPEPAQVTPRLRPYRLLNTLQRDAPDELSDDTLKAIREHAAECEPLLRNALREWGRDEDALDTKTVALVLAILGEISGPDAVDELLELSSSGDQLLFLHTNWALLRLGQRHRAGVMERYRAALAEGSVKMRCAIADQIHLLEPDPADMVVLNALADDFERIRSDEEAGYVLACLVQCLMDRGEKARAAALGKLQKHLPKDMQEMVRDAARGEFTSHLEEENITGLSIEDVCLDRLLMEDESEAGDDEEDYEGEGEEFEDEEEGFDEAFEPEPPPRPGRNEPCWCGSGKKYKKCHLTADEEADRKAREREDGEDMEEDAPPTSAHAQMMHRLLTAAQDALSRRDMELAKKMYFNRKGNIELEEVEIEGFLQWMLHDFRASSTSRTPMEMYLASHGAALTAGERTLLESLRDARFGLYEVERVEPGSGVHLHDIFAGDRMFVHDVSSSNSMSRWDCLLARAQFHEGRWIFAGNGSMVPRNLLEEVRAMVEDESRAAGQTPAEFVRANSHRLHRDVKERHDRRFDNLRFVNREGEEVSFGKAEYDILDEPALLAALRSIEELEEGAPGSGENLWFVWVSSMGGEKRPLGNVEIEGGILKLEAMSRTRLQTLRGLIESRARDLVKHRGDHYTSTEEIKDRFRRGEHPPKPPASVPPPEARAIVERAMAEHYSHWADDRLPALGGKTARQSVRTKAGRAAVIDLLRLMENGEQQKIRAGQPAYDFNILRRELGLPEE